MGQALMVVSIEWCQIPATPQGTLSSVGIVIGLDTLAKDCLKSRHESIVAQYHLPVQEPSKAITGMIQ